jgi:hypothetical protein
MSTIGTPNLVQQAFKATVNLHALEGKEIGKVRVNVVPDFVDVRAVDWSTQAAKFPHLASINFPKPSIERVVDPNPTRPNLWYWAHFPVIKSEKETTKIRPVFDGAAKFRGICINDYIMTGPSVMNKLIAVVHRF